MLRVKYKEYFRRAKRLATRHSLARKSRPAKKYVALVRGKPRLLPQKPRAEPSAPAPAVAKLRRDNINHLFFASIGDPLYNLLSRGTRNW